MRKKTLTLLLLAAALLLTLAGCAPANSFTAERLTVWIWDESEQETWQTVADDWTQRTGVAVEITVKDPDQYWEDVASGALPDLFWMDSAHLEASAAAGQLLPLEARLEEGSLRTEDYYEALWSLWTSGGRTWAVPKDSRVTALWYSRALFDSKGLDYPDESWTWQDVCQAALALTDRAGGLYGFVMNQTDTANGWYNVVCSAGGALLRTGADGTVTAAWTEEQTRAAMGLVGALVADAMPSQPTMAQQGAMELFAAGRAAMVLLDSDQALALLSESGSSQWDCTVLPYWDRDGSGDCGEGERTAVLDGTGWAISAASADPDAAYDLLEAFAGQAGQEAQVSAGVSLPAVSGLQETWEETVWAGSLSPYRTALESGALAEKPRQSAGETWEDYAMSTTLYTAWNNPDAMEEMLADQQAYTERDLAAAASAASGPQSGQTGTDGAQDTRTDADAADHTDAADGADTEEGTETEGGAEGAQEDNA